MIEYPARVQSIKPDIADMAEYLARISSQTIGEDPTKQPSQAKPSRAEPEPGRPEGRAARP